MNSHLKGAFDKYLPLIEAELKKALAEPHPQLAPFYGMMGYHLGWLDENFAPRQAGAGKRLRPVLCLLTCQAAGGDLDQALPAAAGLELVHNFSLVHDDIEDHSPFRRHRPSVWNVWGVPHATNVGDGLFALAYLALYRLADKGLSSHRLLAANQAFAETCLALCEGQYMDMSFEQRLDIDLDEYLGMIRNKTAALIACATQLGAMLATDDPQIVDHYQRFGQNLGMAFQIQDDILGIWGEPEVTGKSAASDILQRKKSLPIVYALEREGRAGKRTLREIYSQEAIGEENIPQVLAVLEDLEAHGYARGMAQEYHRLALDELESTGIENESQALLRELADFLVERAY